MKFVVHVPKLGKEMEFAAKAAAERAASKMRASGFVTWVSEVAAMSAMAEQLMPAHVVGHYS